MNNNNFNVIEDDYSYDWTIVHKAIDINVKLMLFYCISKFKMLNDLKYLEDQSGIIL